MAHAHTPNPNNRLSAETSPYLLQHQDNPVDWWAWGEAALEEARKSNRPILLSVGYAACHWCHVMAHESFEDPEIAALMNKLYVNIKVDREERPDLDAIYQQALALLGQQGGWPLTMFLTPEGRPFWGGTYFPPASRWGRPGFADVLATLAETFAKEPDKVQKNVDGLREAMAKLSSPQAGGAICMDITNQIAARLLEEVDQVQGGIGQAPKFPQVPLFQMFWRAWKRTKNQEFKSAVVLTLTRMSQGGIYDHLGGGFARYSVDANWLVPHFEKMLYDNAELIGLLTLAWQETRDLLFQERVRETVDWLEREMLAAPNAQGDRAFAASLDADSEGEEGKFYVWTEAEIDQVLGAESAFFKQHYDVSAEGNWEGHNILNRSQRPAMLDAAGEERLAKARERLLAARAGSRAAGLGRQGAGGLERPDDRGAGRGGDGVRAAGLAGAGGARLPLHPHQHDEGRPAVPRLARRQAAACGDARRPRASGERRRWRCTRRPARRSISTRRRQLTALLDAHFWDKAAGGYFMTADDVKDVIQRPKSAGDNATPNGNGAMVGVLARLYHLTGEQTLSRPRGGAGGGVLGRARAQLLPARHPHQQQRVPGERGADRGGGAARGPGDPRPDPRRLRPLAAQPAAAGRSARCATSGKTPGRRQGHGGRETGRLCVQGPDLRAAGDASKSPRDGPRARLKVG